GAKLDVRTSMRVANAGDETLMSEGESYVRSLLDRHRAAAAFLPRLAFEPSFFFDDRTGPDGRRSGLDAPLTASFDVNPVSDEAEIRRLELVAKERRSRLLVLQDQILLDVARAHFG